MKHALTKIGTGQKTLVAICGATLIAIVVTALAIYTTPLRYVRLIPPTMNEVDASAVYKNMQAHPEKYLFIDVRPQLQYEISHAPGAINIQIPDLYTDREQFPRSGKDIVLICGDGRSAAVAYGYLQDYGFSNLEHITGGFATWQSESLPIIKGL